MPSEYLNFDRDSGLKTDYVDVIQVAFFEMIRGTKHPANNVDLNTVKAFSKLGFSPEVEILELEGIEEEVEATQDFLK